MEGNFKEPFKRTVVAISAKGIDHVVCQPERHHLRLIECLAFVEEAIKVDMQDSTTAFFK